MNKLIIAIVAFGLIAGCSSSQVKKENRISLKGYEKEIAEACLKAGKYADLSEKDQNTLCTNHAERAMTVSDRMFWSFQEENLLKECKGLKATEFSTCAKAYQKKYFDLSTKTAIEKIQGK